MISKDETVNIARGLIRNKSYIEAENVLLEALINDDGNLMLKGMLADLYIKMQKLTEAERQIEAILKKEPDNNYALQKRGDILAIRGKHNEALEIFMDMHKRGENSYYLYKRISRIYMLKKDISNSLEYAEKAREKSPDRADIYYLLFQLHNKLENFEKAKNAIEKALENDPENKFYYSQKLTLRMNEKNLDSSNLEEIIDISDNDNPHLLKLLGEKLKKEGSLDRAVDVYKRLVSIDDNEFNQKSLGFLYYKKMDYHRAFKIFITLSDSHFLDRIFVTTIIASAKNVDEKRELVDRMTVLANSSDQYRKLWGSIKKLSRDIENDEDL